MAPSSSGTSASRCCPRPPGALADTTLVMDRSLRPDDWGRLGALLAGTHPGFILLD
jgi:hypothetical protein